MENQYTNDVDLFEGIKRGENAANKILFDLLFEKMGRLAFKITKSEDAEDIAINAFSKTIQSVHKFKDLKDLEYYMREAVLNSCKNFLKEKKTRQKKHNEIGYITESFENHIEDSLAKTEFLNGIFKIVEAQCTESQKKVFTLLYIDGLTPKQIGAIMGISDSNVRRIKSDGVKVLRNFFKGKRIFNLTVFLISLPVVWKAISWVFNSTHNFF